MNVYVHERLYHWLYASEGPVPFMYLDKANPRLVTVGIGFMIDPIEDYLGKWGSAFFKDRACVTPASPEDVKTEYYRVKPLTGLGGWQDFEPGAQLFMPARAMKPEVLRLLGVKERAVKTCPWKECYADFDSFPPDAQMGILSTAYGPWLNNTPAQKAFHLACKAQDWHAAAESGYWDGWTDEKRRGHKLMFENAQAAKDSGDQNPQPAFPGMLKTDGSYEIDDQIKPYRQDIWKAGS
jgi:hypothetical protein